MINYTVSNEATYEAAAEKVAILRNCGISSAEVALGVRDRLSNTGWAMAHPYEVRVEKSACGIAYRALWQFAEAI